MLDEDRYTRQRRLADIGSDGQKRIEHTRFHVRGRDGAVVEAQYLIRAGAESVVLEAHRSAPPFAHAEAFRFDGPRRVGAGAWRALSQLRRALGIESG